MNTNGITKILPESVSLFGTERLQVWQDPYELDISVLQIAALAKPFSKTNYVAGITLPKSFTNTTTSPQLYIFYFSFEFPPDSVWSQINVSVDYVGFVTGLCSNQALKNDDTGIYHYIETSMPCLVNPGQTINLAITALSGNATIAYVNYLLFQ